MDADDILSTHLSRQCSGCLDKNETVHTVLKLIDISFEICVHLPAVWDGLYLNPFETKQIVSTLQNATRTPYC